MQTSDILPLVMVTIPSLAMLARITIKRQWHGMTYGEAAMVVLAAMSVVPATLYWIAIIGDVVTEWKVWDRKIGE